MEIKRISKGVDNWGNKTRYWIQLYIKRWDRLIIITIPRFVWNRID